MAFLYPQVFLGILRPSRLIFDPWRYPLQVVLRPQCRHASQSWRQVAPFDLCHKRFRRQRKATVITDPLFYLLAVPAVTFLGLSKRGFAGLGMLATPLLALVVPPLEGAAILLPILICQDAISVWTYHRAWSAWNLKVLLPGSVLGVGAGWLFARHFSNAVIELTIGSIALVFVLQTWFGSWRRAYRGEPPATPRRP